MRHPGGTAVLGLGSMRLPEPPCENRLMGAEGEEEEEAMKGGGSFLNFQIFSENSGCFIQLLRDLQHCSRGCPWWDIKLSLAKAKLNLYHLDASVSNL